MKPLAVRFTTKAALDFQVAAAWWRTNRLAAPQLFEQEVAASLELLASAPSAGAASSDARLADVDLLVERQDGRRLVIDAMAHQRGNRGPAALFSCGAITK